MDIGESFGFIPNLGAICLVANDSGAANGYGIDTALTATSRRPEMIIGVASNTHVVPAQIQRSAQ